MSFTGDGTVAWQFDEISTNFGCRAEGSVVKAGPYTFYLSDRGFCMCDGVQIKQIGAEVFDQYILDTFDTTQFDDMYAAADPIRSQVIWVIGGRLLIYNWLLDKATTANLNALAVFQSFSASQTLEDLDATYTNLDNISFSLDSPKLKGGAPILSMVRISDGKFGALEGDTIAATIKAANIEFVEGRRVRTRFIHPLTDCSSGITINAYTQAQLGGPTTTTTATTITSSGDMPLRTQGRYTIIEQVIAAGSTWTFTNGFTLDFAQGGTR